MTHSVHNSNLKTHMFFFRQVRLCSSRAIYAGYELIKDSKESKRTNYKNIYSIKQKSTMKKKTTKHYEKKSKVFHRTFLPDSHLRSVLKQATKDNNKPFLLLKKNYVLHNVLFSDLQLGASLQRLSTKLKDLNFYIGKEFGLQNFSSARGRLQKRPALTFKHVANQERACMIVLGSFQSITLLIQRFDEFFNPKRTLRIIFILFLQCY